MGEGTHVTTQLWLVFSDIADEQKVDKADVWLLMGDPVAQESEIRSH